MRLLTRLFTHLLTLLPTVRFLPGAASWYGPSPLRMSRPGKSGVAAVRRAARKVRNRRRARRA
ncbi:hypothetical protein [Pseudomonas asiatica]|uniref:Uncharacterized protein n=1 Tax=Pseudomonas asiatica TaxID=2219225 RepID=A0A9X4CXV9_9PSED|nr:hypothetical protein [Pseudomonas asiatica]MDD2105690.1 hypothetical protein [Pseudomonas asiatica]